MDIKWKKFSYSAAAKIIAFIVVVVSYTGLLAMLINKYLFGSENFDYVNIPEYGWYIILVLAGAFIFLMFAIGRSPEDDEIHLSSIDRIYNDINIALCLALIMIWGAGAVQMAAWEQNYQIYSQYFFPCTLLISALGLTLILSLAKHIKNGTFLRHTLLYTLGLALYKFIKDVASSGSTATKIVLIAILYPLIASMATFFFVVVVAAGAWFALQKVKEYEAVKAGIKAVKEGDLNYKIDVPGDGEFAVLAADINSITDGLNKAVENEIKSERMKSELITNVSHDIRTPLTSVITYVDLLKNESDPGKIAEYVQVLEEKSQRLKTLTDDLFEASKAASGNLPVELKAIDPAELIAQGLGEFDEQIQARQLDFKISQPEQKILVNADGKLLWRAIENVFLNICKYALEGSRVYIDIVDQGAEAGIIFKNISAYPLNISADELMERFKRGDESRSSQGSGLGLSIAQSLLEIQGGSFTVEIDGDLFKAIIRLPKSN